MIGKLLGHTQVQTTARYAHLAASKKKGMWMGGLPPLGYDVHERKLVVNQEEAQTVRHIYARYAELGSVRLLQRELEAQGSRQ